MFRKVRADRIKNDQRCLNKREHQELANSLLLVKDILILQSLHLKEAELENLLEFNFVIRLLDSVHQVVNFILE